MTQQQYKVKGLLEELTRARERIAELEAELDGLRSSECVGCGKWLLPEEYKNHGC